MTKRINLGELPAFDAAPYLASDEAIAAYLTDIFAANDAALLATALGDIARARGGMTEIAKRSALKGLAPRQQAEIRHHQPRLHRPWRATA